MLAQDIFNLALYRTRQAGINFGGAPTGTAWTPPAALFLLANQGYGELLSRCVDYLAFCAQEVSFTTANANTPAAQMINMRPINGVAGNPSVLKLLELTYTQNGGATWYIPTVSTDRFRREVGAYIRRLGNYGDYPLKASQQFGEGILEIYPGFAVNGDTVTMTFIPDPTDPNNSAPCSAGGPIAQMTDVPLGPSTFHMALVDYLIYNIADSMDSAGNTKAQAALKRWEQFIETLGEFGEAFGEGDPEQRVQPIYRQMADI